MSASLIREPTRERSFLHSLDLACRPLHRTAAIRFSGKKNGGHATLPLSPLNGLRWFRHLVGHESHVPPCREGPATKRDSPRIELRLWYSKIRLCSIPPPREMPGTEKACPEIPSKLLHINLGALLCQLCAIVQWPCSV